MQGSLPCLLSSKVTQSLNQISWRVLWFVEEGGARAAWGLWAVCALFSRWDAGPLLELVVAYLSEMERKDGEDDKQQPGSLKKRLFKQESSRRHLRFHIKAGGGLSCETLLARCSSGPWRGAVSKLTGVVWKPHVPSSMPCILYALFTLLILTRLISLTADHKSLLVAKKYKNLLGRRHVSHISSPPCASRLCWFDLSTWILDMQEGESV